MRSEAVEAATVENAGRPQAPIIRVIATAGHIDHGKSSLVKALTGVDPDRLPDEKARGMTIELGFARLELSAGIVAGVIDVPGHERFVRHMVAGVGGIDLALLVIAADEALMPQTYEHMAILDLLGVRHGVVALTKVDLVDRDWLELVTDEVRNALRGTSLEASPIVPCSSTTGFGLANLRTRLAEGLEHTPERHDRGRPRVAVDRVFTSSGHGTIVTGTLLDGRLVIGQEVELAPAGLRARIRSLQSHGERLETARPGRRVAANLAGIPVSEINRGMVLCLPNDIPPVYFLDLRVRVLPATMMRGASLQEQRYALTHNMAITLHTGAVEAHGIIRLLDAQGLKPGEQGWAQVRLETPIAALRGDRCVVRIPSPARTVAGGSIVVVNPRRHPRLSRSVLEQLDRAAVATPEERILDALATAPMTAAEITKSADVPRGLAEITIIKLRGKGLIEAIQRDARPEDLVMADVTPDWSFYWAARCWLDNIQDRALALLDAYHRAYPLRRGIASEALRAALGIQRRPWTDLLRSWRSSGFVGESGDIISASGHTIRLGERERELATDWLRQLDASPFSPPTGTELRHIDGEILAALIAQGDPVRLSDGLYLRAGAFAEMRDAALAAIDRDGKVGVAGLRDAFHSSRKVTLALLEYLDDLHVTRRVGDARVRGPGATGNSLSGERH